MKCDSPYCPSPEFVGSEKWDGTEKDRPKGHYSKHGKNYHYSCWNTYVNKLVERESNVGGESSSHSDSSNPDIILSE